MKTEEEFTLSINDIKDNINNRKTFSLDIGTNTNIHDESESVTTIGLSDEHYSINDKLTITSFINLFTKRYLIDDFNTAVFFDELTTEIHIFHNDFVLDTNKLIDYIKQLIYDYNIILIQSLDYYKYKKYVDGEEFIIKVVGFNAEILISLEYEELIVRFVENNINKNETDIHSTMDDLISDSNKELIIINKVLVNCGIKPIDLEY